MIVAARADNMARAGILSWLAVLENNFKAR